ncbi:MAG TPA: ABC transporter permease [Coriobacteriia bacterium]|uniref:ABC transporter permease n=1 Tax=Anaerosoma tenue TaxID=2933588 RepID=UPI00076CBFA8|nr:ABC transporter permease [Anaerosoma tenue]KUK48693.1 MAG: ABC transporter, permease protein [Actinobacteria bacterium 66_15]MCK8113927.1 ABC transporter permease [Anaerosoma tenue]HAL29981.1 ABC transporter permease [Coriobacteriia bacterium]
MFKYVVRRIFQMIPVFLGVTLILFVLRVPGLLPGDPIQLIVGEKPLTPALRAQIEEKNHLNEPLHIQYAYYVSGIAQGDLGESYQKGRAVTDILFDKFPNTFRLALAGILVEIVIGISAGIISAIRQYSFWDVLVTLSTSILVSVPVFWLGLLLQMFFGIRLKEWTGGAVFLPISGMGNPPDFVHLILPAITLASVSTAYVARIMRSQMLEAMGQDYIRTAMAKGLTERAVVFKHALKNALIPVVTYVGIDLGVLMSGAILTETVFSWPGVGREIYLAVMQRDWPVVMGGVIVIVLIVMFINLLVDISYALLDPRIRYGGAAE